MELSKVAKREKKWVEPAAERKEYKRVRRWVVPTELR
jgi:hypothetical protein